MLAIEPDLALRMSASLRRLIKVVDSQTVIGRARLDEIQALFDASRGGRAAKFAGREVDHPATGQPASRGAANAAAGKDHHR